MEGLGVRQLHETLIDAFSITIWPSFLSLPPVASQSHTHYHIHFANSWAGSVTLLNNQSQGGAKESQTTENQEGHSAHLPYVFYSKTIEWTGPYDFTPRWFFIAKMPGSRGVLNAHSHKWPEHFIYNIGRTLETLLTSPSYLHHYNVGIWKEMTTLYASITL